MTARVLRLLPDFDWGIVLPVLGWAMLAVAIGLLASFGVAVGYGEDALAFGLTAAVVLAASGAMLYASRRVPPGVLRPRDGFLAVTMAWLLAAVVGSVPLLLGDTFDRPVEAFFESMSGFTTTGATLIESMESEPRSILFWRSISQWLGGIGIVVLVVAIAPATGLASQRMFAAEATGVETARFTPRIANTAKIIISIYAVLSGACFAAYAIAGMGPFDAVNHVFTTVATAGFSTRTESIAAFDSLAIELVAVTFMILGAINFALYWRAITGRGEVWPQLVEARTFLAILAAAIVAATLSLLLSETGSGFGESLRGATFTVVSLGTTTGYSTVDYTGWADFGQLLLVVLWFVGGCAASTAGGMKVMRVLLLSKIAAQEVGRQLQPTAVQVLKIGGRPFSEGVRAGVLVFALIYMALFVAGSLAVAATGMDIVTASSTAASAINIIGPALGEAGPADGYGAIPTGGLWILAALMLIGRLEIFTVVVILTPVFWRRRGRI